MEMREAKFRELESYLFASRRPPVAPHDRALRCHRIQYNENIRNSERRGDTVDYGDIDKKHCCHLVGTIAMAAVNHRTNKLSHVCENWRESKSFCHRRRRRRR